VIARLAIASGWIVYRAAGSHGNADLVMLKRGHVPLLVQAKGDKFSPFAHFGPDDRSALEREARLAGARAFLAWIPSPRSIAWFSAPGWDEHVSPL
jgi:hypothetical protein